MQKINFQNLPNTTTPVNATNLNQLQTNVENAINDVIDSGSNTNGNYIKYDDGTLICWNEVTTSVAMTDASAGFYRSGFISPFPNFPITFIARPQMFISSQSSGQYITFLLKGYPPSTTNPNDLRVYGTWSSTQNIIFSYLAIGKWK